MHFTQDEANLELHNLVQTQRSFKNLVIGSRGWVSAVVLRKREYCLEIVFKGHNFFGSGRITVTVDKAEYQGKMNVVGSSPHFPHENFVGGW